MTLTITTPPAAEPLTLDEAKAHLRVTHDAEDDLILALLLSARQRVERELGLALIATGFHETLDVLPDGPIPLARAPLIAVTTVSVVTKAGTITLPPDAYLPRLAARDAVVAPATGVSWPLPATPLDGVRIDYTAGFGTSADDVPASLKQAILVLVGYAYDHRGEPDPAPIGLVEPWLAPYRRLRL